jgi:acyl-CoA thioester hydrolase
MARYVETYRGVVYPWLCDQMGHCNVQHYMAMYDQSSIHLFLEIGLNPELMSEQQLGFADVKHVVEYKAEMRAGAAIKGEGRIVEIGNSSIRHEHRLLDANSLFDLAARRACPLPDNMRAKAEAAIKAGAGD